MTPEEFLQQLNPHSRVFDLSIDYKYTEEQLVLFAKLYHESELKNFRVTDVSVSVCPFYMSGNDTSGKCNNCGKNKWEH
jgi:hypothetical protein